MDDIELFCEKHGKWEPENAACDGAPSRVRVQVVRGAIGRTRLEWVEASVEEYAASLDMVM